MFKMFKTKYLTRKAWLVSDVNECLLEKKKRNNFIIHVQVFITRLHHSNIIQLQSDPYSYIRFGAM